MSTTTITAGTLLGGPGYRRVTVTAGQTLELRCDLVEIRVSTRLGDVRLRVDTGVGDLATSGDRHEGALL